MSATDPKEIAELTAQAQALQKSVETLQRRLGVHAGSEVTVLSARRDPWWRRAVVVAAASSAATALLFTGAFLALRRPLPDVPTAAAPTVAAAPPPYCPAGPQFVVANGEPSASPFPARPVLPPVLREGREAARPGFGRPMGALTIVCMPVKCDNVIDNGVQVGPGHVFSRPVQAGQHRLVLSAPDGATKNVVVEVLPNQLREVRVSMSRDASAILNNPL